MRSTREGISSFGRDIYIYVCICMFVYMCTCMRVCMSLSAHSVFVARVHSSPF